MALQWTEKGSLKGPKGDKGDTGPKGAAGASIRTAHSDIQPNSDVSVDQITPSANIAVNDLILDTAGQVYAVASVQEGVSVHVGQQLDVSLKGPKGDTGPAGADGKDGTGVTILGSYENSGALQEAHPTGNPGDAYLVDGDLSFVIEYNPIFGEQTATAVKDYLDGKTVESDIVIDSQTFDAASAKEALDAGTRAY